MSSKFVVRDSAQVATRIRQGECGPDFTNNLGLSETRDHCGGMSIWGVASGGRMGMVTGEDATEVANPPTTCTRQCQAQNQVRGRLANLGFPFPVPTGSRLSPRVFAAGSGRTADAVRVATSALFEAATRPLGRVAARLKETSRPPQRPSQVRPALAGRSRPGKGLVIGRY